MRLTNNTTIALLALVGCGVDASDETGAVLRIEPADATHVVTDGQPVTTQYRAYLVSSDGAERDVTADTRFELSRPELGTWRATNDDISLELRGAAVGPSAIRASYAELSAAAGIEVYAHTRIVEENAGLANAPALFDAVRSDFSCFPQIVYPETGTVMPSNLDGLEVHWMDFTNDIFEVSFETQYATVELYTTNMHRALSADSWAQLASTTEPVMVHVSGINAGSPAVACTSTKRRLLVADQALKGALYSWSEATGIWRHDVETRGEPEPVQILPPLKITTLEPTIQTGSFASTCVGCAVSKNGARMAVRLDNGAGAIVDFTQDSMTMPMTWESATFTPTADKLVVEHDGVLRLLGETGIELATLVNTEGTSAQDPQLSPDGSKLVNVESTGFSPTGKGDLVIRSVTENIFGDATILVGAQPGVAHYSPSWSPDGKWLAFTRATGWGTASPLASIWVVKADGSEPAIQLVAPTADVDMAARWAPATYSLEGESFYYLTFDSLRPYGRRTDLGRQIWTMAFFPATKLAHPAFHVPFQSSDLSNHVSQWTTALVR
jgi:TolB protein